MAFTTRELPKTYEPHDVEDRWIGIWETRLQRSPNNQNPPFCIVIPPPNVTGSLHMGHALNSTLQDILIRYHRMKGDDALWIVGTDHAGIATQNVVERQLQAEGKTRHDLGREKFIECVWQWRKESGSTIINQLKRLGASADYANERFTMDQGLSAAVRKVFVSLHREGLIYRGERLINWCPRCRTALSDLEVEHEKQKGQLWHIRYPLVPYAHGQALVDDGYLTVATTRPETMLGDAAVAVNPADDRYTGWRGIKVHLPLTHRDIPVITDEHVDPQFGSGVVKVTPAHDFNDFEIGNRHKLPRINILNPDGRMNEQGDAYQGLTVTEARKRIVADLECKGLLEKIENHELSVGHCYRCKTVVEPYLSFQWFVKAKPLADAAIKAVREGKTKFIPEHWEKTYFNWMENIQDWCISRQIWWGHRIPAWYCTKGCKPIVSEAVPSSCPDCGGSALTQDPDVLDTWFSSALWPFSTLGWPDKTERLQKFYPTAVLVTAFDIIFFWVARMMMMGIHFMGESPFRHVHIHALVRDPTGQKMSKSKGNVVDPLLMMKQYGTDAFRFTLAAFAAQGRDIKLDEARIDGYRNFCNKIWNAARYMTMTASPYIQSARDFEIVLPQNRINRWILAELNKAIAQNIHGIENYEFNHAASSFYQFFWMSFCDWYVEFTKEIFKEGSDLEKKETAQTLYYVLDQSLRLMHPFMPFISEEIWQIMVDRKNELLAQSAYPRPFNTVRYEGASREMQVAIDTISAIRSIRQETGVPTSQPIVVKIQAAAPIRKLYTEVNTMIKKLGKVSEISFLEDQATEPAAIAKTDDALIIIPLQGLIDTQKELGRQMKKKEKLEKEMGDIHKKLGDPGFVERAPSELIAEKKLQLTRAIEEKEIITQAIRSLQS